jgi:thymidylate synthase
MKILSVRNAHEALPRAIGLLKQEGIERDSRNGSVITVPYPVVTQYSHSWERVVFWERRDTNIAFLVAEALWMLRGRNDLALIARYIPSFKNYSDDGKTLHGAYGNRWRHAWGFDQLDVIVERLTLDPTDRRCVLAMWDAEDLITTSKDLPCNDTVTFQRNHDGALDMTVFCRSNDILWGAYFANAFHFGVLHEYMAARIGCPIGIYRQISVNWHAYTKTIEPYLDYVWPVMWPYRTEQVEVAAFASHDLDHDIAFVLNAVDQNFEKVQPEGVRNLQPALRNMFAVLLAHHHRADYAAATEALNEAEDPRNDYIVAMRRWLDRR